MNQQQAAEIEPAVNERVVLFILAAVQFTSIIDFMLVMPLGPQLERTLGLSPAQFGFVVSSYTFAAGIAGIGASMFIDRFSRRSTFLVLFGGFLAGTLACGFAPGYRSLLAARFVTGAFGGVLGGMAMAIIGDVFPEERRGTATGILMSSFALASVFGVPLGIFLGIHFGWRFPFRFLSVVGLPILLAAAKHLPRLDAHLHGEYHTARAFDRLAGLFTHPNHLRAFALTSAIMFAGFAIFPYLPPYFVSNLGIDESNLPFIYIVGGLMALGGSPLAGRMSDRYGKLRVFRMISPISAAIMLLLTNLPPVPISVAVLSMASLMLFNSARMVPAMSMITSSVESRRRGGFLGANSAVQHIAAGLGTSAGGLILAHTADGKLRYFPIVGLLAACSTIWSMQLAGRLRLAEPGPTVAPAGPDLA